MSTRAGNGEHKRRGTMSTRTGNSEKEGGIRQAPTARRRMGYDEHEGG